MPITKSAKKSLKVSRTKKVRNDVYRKKLEIALKKVDGKNISSIISLIDKTAKVGIISKGKANRVKSQLTKKFGTPARHASQQGVAGRPKQEKSEKRIENSKTLKKKTLIKKTTTKKPVTKPNSKK